MTDDDTPQCPVCRSDNVIERGDGLLKCLDCNTLFKSNGGATIYGPDPDEYDNGSDEK